MPNEEGQLYYVVETLKEHQVRITALHDSHHKFETLVLVELAKLKVKAGTWGAIGGGIPVVGAILLYVLKGLI
jgi:hypothetical protein